MILERIVKVKQQEVARLRETFDWRQAESEIRSMPETLGFSAFLRSAGEPLALIAEVKKASPSKGVIRPDFDPVAIAKQYETAGANAISVLTDEEFFQGHPEYLRQIRQAVRLPLLRKDFLIDETQIYEARLLGADAVLLIAGLLTRQQLQQYRQLAEEIGLDSLIEAHNLHELDDALAAGATMIGINNRNLHTFGVDLQTTASLAKQLPEETLLISESGIFTYADVQFVKQAGADGILVGESLMRSSDVELAVAQLLGKGQVQA